MDLQFENAAAAARKLQNTCNEDKKLLYGLYKQAREGDNTFSKPWYYTNPIAYEKWAAWESLRGVPKEQAKQRYVDLVKQLLQSTQ